MCRAQGMWKIPVTSSQFCCEPKTPLKTNKKILKGFPGGSVMENLPASAGDRGSILGPGRPHMLWSKHATTIQPVP